MFDIIKNKISSDTEKDTLVVNETKKEFKKLSKIFNSETEDAVDFQLLEEIIKKLDIEEIVKEMQILSLILETDINSNKNIIEKINLLKEKTKKCDLLKKLILLLNDFEFNESIIKNALEKSKEDLEHTSSLKKLFEIDIKIKELNLDILNPKKNKNSLTVLDKMYERPEFINFFKNKTIYDIR